MSFPISVQFALDILPDLTVDSSQEISTASIQAEIDFSAAEIRKLCEDQGYDITVPTVHQRLILEFLNCCWVWKQIILRRASAVDATYLLFFRALDRICAFLRGLIEKCWLIESWFPSTGIPLPAVSLITGLDAGQPVPYPVMDATTAPTLVVAQRWADYWAQIIYSVAAINSYPTPANPLTLTADQLNVYKEINKLLASSLICRVRASQNATSDISRVEHDLADQLYAQGINRLALLQKDFYYALFN